MRISNLKKIRMEEFKNEFEKHERLTEFISEMASTGRVPREWSIFIAVLNEALSQHDVSGEVCYHSADKWCTSCYEEKKDVIIGSK